MTPADRRKVRAGFDAAFYAAAYPEAAANDPFGDYLSAVRDQRRDPSSGFSESFYLTRNPDVAQTVLEGHFLCGFHHFVVYGRAEGRAPRPSNVHDDTAAREREIAASGLFDAAWYRETHDRSDRTDTALLRAYLATDPAEGRCPNPYFDPAWYLRSHREVASTGLHPLTHYIRSGEAEGRRPSPWFDPIWYQKTYLAGQNIPALAHFLARRCSGEVAPLRHFDPAFYRRVHPDIAQAGIDPFLHYLHYGYREGRDPAADFNTRYYAAQHLGDRRDINPLMHFLERGAEAGLNTAPSADTPSSAAELRRSTTPGPFFEAAIADATRPETDVKLLAYYLPQFHAFAENNAWWGEGFTEWTNIGRGFPRFVGHYQPRIPRDLGFYDLTDPAIMRPQIDLARSAGVHGFCFYHYFFDGRRLMAGPVDRFLADASLAMPFCLMWANENWTRRWDGDDQEVLIAQSHAAEHEVAMVADFARHMADARYIRVGGRPLLMLYRPGIIPDSAAAIARWRELFRRNHGESPIIIMAQGFGDYDPRLHGLDGAVEFPPHKLVDGAHRINGDLVYLDPAFKGHVYNYDDVAAVAQAEPPPDFPLIKTVVPNWDNDARRQGRGLTLHGSTPVTYQSWLQAAAEFSRRNPFFGENIVCVNAWNEWGEGAYLEPDLHFGSAYLNATRRALTAPVRAGKSKILLVGHDGFPAGAQTLLLHLGQLYRNRFGIEIAFLLLGGGALVPRYQALAATEIADTPAALTRAIAAYRAAGFQQAIVNTSAACRIVPLLSDASFRTTLLIHEGPRIIAERRFADDLRHAIPLADRVVLSSRFLADGLTAALGENLPATIVIQPQGLYCPIAVNPRARARVRSLLGITDRDTLILGVGYADLRKGFDIFLQMWRHARLSETKRVSIHCLWVGNLDPDLAIWLRPEIDDAVASGTFHHIPFTDGIADYYAACDVFALTSREDPYPSVVLEAICADRPVVAFAGTGGIPEILGPDIGTVVAHCDARAMLDAALTLARSPPSKRRARARKTLIEQHDFAAYGWMLLDPAKTPLRTSVIVPSYRHRAHLPARMDSLFRQNAPVFEVVALDDASPDGSLAALKSLRASSGRDFRIVGRQHNSGSAFGQWRAGLRLCSGDLVWIAEADDSCAPNLLARLSAAFEDPDVVLAFCDSRAIDGEGSLISESYRDYYDTVEPGLLSTDMVINGRDFLARHLSVKNLILNVSSVVWRRPALEAALRVTAGDLTGFRLAGDWLIYAEVCLLPNAKIAYVAAPLNHHRRHAAGATQTLPIGRHLAEIRRIHGRLNKSLRSPRSVVSARKAYLEELVRQFADES